MSSTTVAALAAYTLPLAERARLRAELAGSAAQTLRGRVRAACSSERAWPQTRGTRLRRDGWCPRASRCTPAEREDRRAAADPAFRRRLIARLRRLHQRQLATLALAPTDHSALIARLRSLGARGDLQATIIPQLYTARDDAWRWARGRGLPICQRRGDWDVRPTGGASRAIDEASGGTVWADSGRPVYGDPTRFRRRDVEYVPACHEIRILARAARVSGHTWVVRLADEPVRFYCRPADWPADGTPRIEIDTDPDICPDGGWRIADGWERQR